MGGREASGSRSRSRSHSEVSRSHCPSFAHATTHSNTLPTPPPALCDRYGKCGDFITQHRKGLIDLAPGCDADESLENAVTGVLNNIREAAAKARRGRRGGGDAPLFCDMLVVDPGSHRHSVYCSPHTCAHPASAPRLSLPRRCA